MWIMVAVAFVFVVVIFSVIWKVTMHDDGQTYVKKKLEQMQKENAEKRK